MTSDGPADEARLNPRTRRVRQVILDAAVDLLLTHGAHDVTASRVAEHADVARTTIYRHWPDQASLLLATIDSVTAPHHEPSSQGSLETDLRANLQGLRTRLLTRNVRPVFGALAANAARDDAFVAAQRRFIEQMTQPVLDTLRAAQARGELDPALDCELEATLLTIPLLHQHLVMHDDMAEQVLDELISRWLATHRSA